MVKVAVGEFRAHMAKYLTYVMDGKVVMLTSHGKTVAEIKQPTDHQAEAKAKLAALAKDAKIGDILSPSIDQFEAM